MSLVQSDVLIVGAGISGLHFGLAAQDAGNKVTIIEKSQGLGGRLATRRLEDKAIDHGIQFFNHQDEIAEFLSHYKINQNYVPGGMTVLAKEMSKNLLIHRSQRADKIAKIQGEWNIETIEGMKYSAERLIITAPMPQAQELLETNLIHSYAASSIINSQNYDKALEGIFLIDDLPKNLTSFEKYGHKITLMREKNLHPDAILLALNPELSDSLWSEGNEHCLDVAQKVLEELCPIELKIRHRELKRWRYAFPKKAHPFPFIEVQKDLFLIGDSFLYPDIRGAILSAESLANHLYKK